MAASLDNPQLKLPLTITGDSFDQIEQDSYEDVRQCVETVATFPQGLRDDLPEFGISDHTFSQAGAIRGEAIIAEVLRWEPRADITPEGERFGDDPMQRIITLAIQRRNIDA